MMRWVFRGLLYLSLGMLSCLNPRAGQGQALIDGTVATVGTRMILYSDVEMEMLRMRLQGQSTEQVKPCKVLEDLLVHHLLLDQADLDSVRSFDDEAAQEVEQRISFFLQQTGSEAELERQYGKSIKELKREMQGMMAQQRRAQFVRQEIIKNVKVTPSQVKEFYQQVPVDSLPLVPESYIYRQLVLKPVESEEADFLVRERLLELRERILKGERFATLAVAYSEDRNSAVRGGEMGFLPKESFVKPFADAAFSLQEGQVSQIVKTEFGYHIIQMIGRRGDMVNVRHILMKPTYSSEIIQQTILRADSIAGLTKGEDITFENICSKYSDDTETKNNGGLAVNPQMGGVKLTRETMMPVDYFSLQKLQEGSISSAFESRDSKGNVVVKVVQLVRRIDSHRMNLDDDYPEIMALAKQHRESEVFERWLRGKRANIYLRLEPIYSQCDFTRSFWLSAGAN